MNLNKVGGNDPSSFTLRFHPTAPPAFQRPTPSENRRPEPTTKGSTIMVISSRDCGDKLLYYYFMLGVLIFTMRMSPSRLRLSETLLYADIEKIACDRGRCSVPRGGRQYFSLLPTLGATPRTSRRHGGASLNQYTKTVCQWEWELVSPNTLPRPTPSSSAGKPSSFSRIVVDPHGFAAPASPWCPPPSPALSTLSLSLALLPYPSQHTKRTVGDSFQNKLRTPTALLPGYR